MSDQVNHVSVATSATRVTRESMDYWQLNHQMTLSLLPLSRPSHLLLRSADVETEGNGNVCLARSCVQSHI